MSGALVEQSPLPNRQVVREVVEGMIGRNVNFSDGRPVPGGRDAVTAVYVNDALRVMAVAVVDLPGAARLGGALGLVPKGGVDDAIDEKDLPENLRDNCYEILNVLASVFNVPEAPHVRLYEMHGPGDIPPTDVQSLSAMLGSREDVQMDIAGYGTGCMSIIVK
jgi:hypothetical protein